MVSTLREAIIRMTNSLIQINQIPAGADVSLSISGENARQIANAPGGIIEFISLDTTDKIPLERVRFDESHYNLFVIDGPIKTNGSITIPDNEWLKNSQPMIPNGLTSACLQTFIMYPAIIVRANQSYRKSTRDSNAALAMVFNPQVGNDKKSIKFNYIISKLFPAQILNDRWSEFGIFSSEQSNELDHTCWEIKHINIIKALGLEDGISGKE